MRDPEAAGVQAPGRPATNPTRRRLLVASLATSLAALAIGVTTPGHAQGHAMYGLIGKLKAQPGQRDALVAVLLGGSTDMPGCLGYTIALDQGDADALWITEVWDSEASHTASLQLPQVRDAIAKGRPLIAGFGERFVTTPVGGQGLPGR